MINWDSETMALIYQIYGLAFFVLGVVIAILPKQKVMFHFIEHLNWLSCFGILHSLVEFIELQKLLNNSETLTIVSWILLLLSYLCLLEFGRRIWCDEPHHLPLYALPLYSVLILCMAIPTYYANDSLLGLIVGARYFIGMPAALLIGISFYRIHPQNENDKQFAYFFHIVAVAFICYGILTPFLSKNDLLLPNWLLTQTDFILWFGFPVQLARTICIVLLSIGFVALIKLTWVNNNVDATAFESQEAIVITDANTIILRVNKTFSQNTGYLPDEVIGKKINIFKSGYHDREFYCAMWQSIHKTQAWQGEIWNRRKNNDIYPNWLTISAIKNSSGDIIHYVGTYIDITERKAFEETITQLAFYDPLTKLPNRRLLLNRLQQALANSTRNQLYGALLFIDLDNFKALNDTHGHDKGDLLLKQVAERLNHCMRESDTVARLGGDEFVILLENLSYKKQEAANHAEIVAEKILATLNKPYVLINHEQYSSSSIGITLFNNHNENIDELLKQADIAMYQAKSAGRNNLRFFDTMMQTTISARVNLEEDLRTALAEKQFLLFYQMQVNKQGNITGAEALIRWQHPQRGLISPAEFIPLAEETGLILPLSQWVLETACKQLVEWSKQIETAQLTLSVNISALQFHDNHFVEQVLTILEYTGANPYLLKLEITESLLLSDMENVIIKMTQLKNKGINFSLDDFGTGYSSLYYLKCLPLYQLKIDKSFIRDVLTDKNDVAIIQAIITMAHSLGLSVIAEGVETELQRDVLIKQGCHSFQGYLFGRPQPIENLHE